MLIFLYVWDNNEIIQTCNCFERMNTVIRIIFNYLL